MNVIEARRPRHLIIRVDRGDELPTVLAQALDEIEAKAGWIEGTGTLEAAEIAPADPSARGRLSPRRIEGPSEVVSLTGSIASQGGVSNVRLWVTLARETEFGLQLAAGELLWGRALALELLVTAFDDVILARIPDERSGQTVLAAQAGALSAPGAPAMPVHAAQSPASSGATTPNPLPTASMSPATSSTTFAQPAPAQAATGQTFQGGSPVPADAPRTMTLESPRPSAAEPSRAPATDLAAAPGHTAPQRPARQATQHEEAYPEIGDLVTHFHFGECEVIGSDGERIRLRQERDGRVREVALTMLKIEAPVLDPVTGKHRFKLARKH
ncbi:PPC domain-containing DNA-binding protein [Chondromyces apiculatus]|uniref:PPC domain-containing protein n=1 Tax=Chondromyces apiculatus DSM 436 TaxID=1192034 RepID=A0A017TI60_9BACT|nr:PPC domain-containing DNA-binding protein [Chondromyces apiculatus]EYF08944.1 Hypothetical protein CAP_0028 [Chondromyces apiculatus DSM 436]